MFHSGLSSDGFNVCYLCALTPIALLYNFSFIREQETIDTWLQDAQDSVIMTHLWKKKSFVAFPALSKTGCRRRGSTTLFLGWLSSTETWFQVDVYKLSPLVNRTISTSSACTELTSLHRLFVQIQALKWVNNLYSAETFSSMVSSGLV